MSIKGKQLIVNALENGTVLDHIPSNQTFRVIEILHLYNYEHQITFGVNLDSKTLGKKGIIKISDLFLKDEELNKIALIAPKVSVNIIKNFEVSEKKISSIPETVIGIAKCMNPMCVTNHQPIATKFKTIVTNSSLELLCNYCEKHTDSKNLKIISNSR